MSSGMGVRGTMGRCYGFFSDYKQCQEDVRAGFPELKEGCYKHREDYFECLHGKKEKARMQAVLAEQKKQAYEAKHGPAH